MEQDLRTCPGCGAPSPEHPTCPYCGWTPNLFEESDVDAIESIETGPAQFRELLEPSNDPEHLLDQVPEEMRGVLAARLKSAEDSNTPSFSEATSSILRDQGYIVSQDARGARLSATPGQAADFSPSEVVKLAADPRRRRTASGQAPHLQQLPICQSGRQHPLSMVRRAIFRRPVNFPQDFVPKGSNTAPAPSKRVLLTALL